MEQTSFPALQEERLDVCIAVRLGCPRTKASSLIKQGAVRINGATTLKCSKKVEAGDTISILSVPVTAQQAAWKDTPGMERDPLGVLYEDEACIVMEKPAGVTVHPGSGTRDEPTLIALFRAQRKDAGLHLVHRLDKETTGCLLVAKNSESLAELQKQFQNHTVTKQYSACVYGVPREARAMIDAPIGRSLLNRTKMSLFRSARSREAQTEYVVTASAGNASLLRLTLHTGRTHQIRVHLAGIGHPVLGDTTYGTDESRAYAEEHAIDALLLHASLLSFRSPLGEEITVEAPLPRKFQHCLEKVGL